MAARSRIRAGVAAVLLAAAAVLLTGCDSPPPSPTGFEFVPSQGSGWSSGYEIFCNHGNRVYSSVTSGGGLAVVPGDPSCKTP